MVGRLAVVWMVALIAGVAAGLLWADVPAPAVAVAQEPVREPHLVGMARPATRPVADPVAIRIPTIGVRAAVRPVGLKPDGAMEVPAFGYAGWYTKGPRPGARGPAVIVAHVDSYKGPDVFFRLRELRRGALIVVRRSDGSSGVWQVVRKEQTPKDRLPAKRIWNDTHRRLLRLVTCGGSFDEASGHYLDNVIVYATPLDV